MPYIFQAALWCDPCGRAIVARLEADGRPRRAFADSDDFPQHVHAIGESDSPDHCDAGPACLEPLVLGKARHLTIGAFLGNELTTEGQAYVRSVGRRGAVGKFWYQVFGL